MLFAVKGWSWVWDWWVGWAVVKGRMVRNGRRMGVKVEMDV